MSGRALVFDTRYFLHLFYTKDQIRLRALRELAENTQPKWVSAITLMEVYKVTSELEGREEAERRSSLIQQDFRVRAVDAEVATAASALQAMARLSEAEAIVAATALVLRGTCVTDDPHLRGLDALQTKWV